MTGAPAALLLLWLLFGIATGIAHFALLRWNANLYVTDGGLLRALAMQSLRMTTTTALLAFAAWHGALPLLAAAIGIMLARVLVLRMMTVEP